MQNRIRPIDGVEIITLQDNYIDLLIRDDSDVIQRAVSLKGLEIKSSILAEHGFSTLVSLFFDGGVHQLLFDFGFSEQGAAFNADAMDIDLSSVELLVLSHGHFDHFGGILELRKRISKTGIELICHPTAFRSPRMIKVTEDLKVLFPRFPYDLVKQANVNLVETDGPLTLLENCALFLGEIPRRTDFEQVPPAFCYEDCGVDKKDNFEDDSALVFYVRDKGLIILTGCGHAGIINTILHAQEVTGVQEVFAVMGGFHLANADHSSVVVPTMRALQEIDPQYIVPTHCTGRSVAMYMEKEMPEQFLLNMSGTKMTFKA